MSDPSNSEDVFNSRARLFSLLLMRLRVLHQSRPVPDSFYIGQDYVEDQARVDCIIAANFLCPGYIKEFEFWFHGAKVNGTQYENVLLVRLYRSLSVRLWDDLRLKNVGERFIIGYLNTLMPKINRYLIDNRYNEGHLLSRTFAIFEAVDVSVTVAARRLWLDWPQSISYFPPSVQLSGKITALYVRDYIDAIHAFFRNEYDDCVRRVITGTENFLETKKWKAKRSSPRKFVQIIRRLLRIGDEQGSLFRRRLADNLKLNSISGHVINENLQFVYKVRNKIVHNGYRMSTNCGMFCDKAVCSLYYLIYRYSEEREISKYACTLHQQFTHQKNFLGKLYDLDEVEHMFSKPESGGNTINSPAEFENFMFNSLRFTERDKRSI